MLVVQCNSQQEQYQTQDHNHMNCQHMDASETSQVFIMTVNHCRRQCVVAYIIVVCNAVPNILQSVQGGQTSQQAHCQFQTAPIIQ